MNVTLMFMIYFFKIQILLVIIYLEQNPIASASLFSSKNKGLPKLSIGGVHKRLKKYTEHTYKRSIIRLTFVPI